MAIGVWSSWEIFEMNSARSSRGPWEKIRSVSTIEKPFAPGERKRTDDCGKDIHHLVVWIEIFFDDELDTEKDRCHGGDGEKIRDGPGTCFHSSTIPKPD